jgi:hypothetical protein
MISAPARYKVYEIPKKSGGSRKIAQPAREVKLLQRALVSVLLAKLPVHACATAYVEGSSIGENARRHTGSGPILKMDLKDFFPSIKSSDWVEYCKKTGCLDDLTDIHMSASLLFRRAKGSSILNLAIGAPSSPLLSNILMFSFDEMIFNAVSDQYVNYTRYADDLTFSGLRAGYLVGVQSIVAKTIRSIKYPSLDINDNKTTFATKKFRRTITGVTLTNDGLVSVGHHRKKKIQAAVHKVSLGLLSAVEIRRLCGVLAFVNSVEPAFIDMLRKKYTPELIARIQSAVVHEKIDKNVPSKWDYSF